MKDLRRERLLDKRVRRIFTLGKPRRFDGVVLRRRLGPCSRPFALKLPIDRLPGSLWSPASTIVTRLNSRFRWKVRNLLDQGDSTRIRLGDHRGVLPPSTPVVDRNLPPRKRLSPRPNRGPSQTLAAIVGSTTSSYHDIVNRTGLDGSRLRPRLDRCPHPFAWRTSSTSPSQIPRRSERLERRSSMNCVHVWIHALSQQ